MDDLKFDENGSIILPQPDEITGREKEDAMGAYLMMFATWGMGLPLPFLSLIAAVIYHFINRKSSRFVGFHSLQSLVTEIPISLLNGFFIVWLIYILIASRFEPVFDAVFLSAFIFTLFWNLIYIVFSIIAAFKARKGQFYYFIFFGRVAFNAYYGRKANGKPQVKTENKPPADF